MTRSVCSHKRLIYVPSENDRSSMAEICLLCGEVLGVVEPGDPGLALEGDPNEWSPPAAVAAAAERMHGEFLGRPWSVGRYEVVGDDGAPVAPGSPGWWVEVHTLGCRREADCVGEDECWSQHWEVYDEAVEDSGTWVAGDPADGVFVTAHRSGGVARNSDERLRRAERAWRETGSPEDRRRYMIEMQRLGRLDPIQAWREGVGGPEFVVRWVNRRLVPRIRGERIPAEPEAVRVISGGIVEISYISGDEYAGRILVPHDLGWYVWEFDELCCPRAGFGAGVAYDSDEAFDEMAMSAVSFGSYWTTDNRGEDTPEWAPDAHVADAISEEIDVWRVDDDGHELSAAEMIGRGVMFRVDPETGALLEGEMEEEEDEEGARE